MKTLPLSIPSGRFFGLALGFSFIAPSRHSNAHVKVVANFGAFDRSARFVSADGSFIEHQWFGYALNYDHPRAEEIIISRGWGNHRTAANLASMDKRVPNVPQRIRGFGKPHSHEASERGISRQKRFEHETAVEFVTVA